MKYITILKQINKTIAVPPIFNVMCFVDFISELVFKTKEYRNEQKQLSDTTKLTNIIKIMYIINDVIIILPN
jgi:hypothetical protein